MNITTDRLYALTFAIITSIIFLTTASAASLSDSVDNVFSKFTGIQQDEFLDPDDAFIVSAEAISENVINVHWQIADGYYLYSDKFQFSIQQSNLKNSPTISDIQLPPGKLKNDPNFGSIRVNYHDIDAQISIQRNNSTASTLELFVHYQGCKENTLCYPPRSKILPIDLIASIAVKENTRTNRTAWVTAPKQNLSAQDAITEHLSNTNFLQNILIFFGFGLLLSLTPCVFPMIPILAGIIVDQGSRMTTLRSFYMSLSYVIAMALSYAVLGIIAGSFTFNLQIASQNIWVISAFSAVFVLLALSMFGFYALQLPISWQNKLARTSDKQDGTLHGAAVMGVLSAIIVGPCVAPPLAGALLYISQTGDAVLGGSALFAMGMGMGILLLVVGTSTGKLLPKAGVWMVSIKHIFGVLMLGVAIWFMGRVLPDSFTLVLWALLFIGSAISMGTLDGSKKLTSWRGVWRGVGLVMLVYGILLIILAATGGNNMLKPWQGVMRAYQSGTVASNTLPFQRIKSIAGLQSALYVAHQADKFIMLDFYADWCIACKEMEHQTFTDARVHKILHNVVLLQVDVTENNTLDKALLKKFNLYGPPAILFFDKQGIEKKSHRILGFMQADDFLQQLNAVLDE